ncbi:unnamed protein product [Ixodes pacificus]
MYSVGFVCPLHSRYIICYIITIQTSDVIFKKINVCAAYFLPFIEILFPLYSGQKLICCSFTIMRRMYNFNCRTKTPHRNSEILAPLREFFQLFFIHCHNVLVFVLLPLPTMVGKKSAWTALHHHVQCDEAIQMLYLRDHVKSWQCAYCICRKASYSLLWESCSR